MCSSGHITGLSLAGLNMVGTIPASLAGLAQRAGTLAPRINFARSQQFHLLFFAVVDHRDFERQPAPLESCHRFRSDNTSATAA
jgi:hypothetical protein